MFNLFDLMASEDDMYNQPLHGPLLRFITFCYKLNDPRKKKKGGHKDIWCKEQNRLKVLEPKV